MSSIHIGGLAPRFTAPTVTNPRFPSASFGARYVLLAFLPTGQGARQPALGALAAHRGLFDDARISAFGVLRDEQMIQMARDQVGLRWFLDRDGAVSRLYGALSPAGDERPLWVLIDPYEVIVDYAPIEDSEGFFDRLRELPDPTDYAGVPLVAPVLITPGILEPDLCRRLIAFYDQAGGRPSGVMREVDGKTVPMLDDYKRRKDATVTDPSLMAEVNARLAERLAPRIRKAFQFRVTRVERSIVACYDAEDGGYFLAHRDDTTRGTAHRRFACTINLNAEDYEGGDLKFPEFGQATYRGPTGGAVVFSCSLLHEATPVTRGRRYAYLPFLYDEAAAAIREANLDSLADSEPELSSAP